MEFSGFIISRNGSKDRDQNDDFMKEYAKCIMYMVYLLHPPSPPPLNPRIQA